MFLAFIVFSFNRCTDDFNGAQCKAVCVEAGMIALRREATVVTHEDFMDGILEVQAKKKQTLNYYAWFASSYFSRNFFSVLVKSVQIFEVNSLFLTTLFLLSRV